MGVPLVLALHPNQVIAAVLVVLVGILAAGLATVGYAAARRSGNRSLHYVTAAFAVFAVKGLFTGWAVWTRAVRHENLELILSLADLVIIGLLAFPLFDRWRRARAAPVESVASARARR